MKSFEELCQKVGFAQAVLILWENPQKRGEISTIKAEFKKWLEVYGLPSVDPELQKLLLAKMQEKGTFPDWVETVKIALSSQNDLREIAQKRILDLISDFGQAFEVLPFFSRESANWQQVLKKMARHAQTFEHWHDVFSRAEAGSELERHAEEKMLKTATTFGHFYRAYQSFRGEDQIRAEVLNKMEEAGTLEDWSMVHHFAVPNSDISKRAIKRMAELASEE